MGFLNQIYDGIYYVGIQTLRYGKRIFKWLLSLLLKPIKALGMLIFTAIIVINKHALRTFHKSVDDFKNLIYLKDKKPDEFTIAGSKHVILKYTQNSPNILFMDFEDSFILVDITKDALFSASLRFLPRSLMGPIHAFSRTER